MALKNILVALLALSTPITAHMQIVFPLPLNDGDPAIRSPVQFNNFPCQGTLTGIESVPPVATFTQGGPAKFEVEVNTAVHSGGSCQVSLSYDKGQSWKVIHSFIGGCPTSGGTFPFTIPSDAPVGKAIFAWSWSNKTGNREFYMNCASIEIKAGTGPAPSIPFDQRPLMFVSDLGPNDCHTVDSKDLNYPDPGPDTTPPNAPPGNPSEVLAPPHTCAAHPFNGLSNTATFKPGHAGAGVDSGNTPPPAPTAGADVESGVFITKPHSSAGQPTASLPSASPLPATGANKPSTDQRCGPEGGSQTCTGTSFGKCCSKFGYCGITDQHCLPANGCRPEFGECSVFTAGSSRAVPPPSGQSTATSPSPSASKSASGLNETEVKEAISLLKEIKEELKALTAGSSPTAKSGSSAASPAPTSGTAYKRNKRRASRRSYN